MLAGCTVINVVLLLLVRGIGRRLAAVKMAVWEGGGRGGGWVVYHCIGSGVGSSHSPQKRWIARREDFRHKEDGTLDAVFVDGDSGWGD